MYRLIHNSKLPSFIKVLLYILFAITLIYWFIITLYKVLELFRKLLHWLTIKNNYWVFIVCIIICLVIAFCLGQWVFNLDPFGKTIQFLVDKWNLLRQWVANLIY